MHLTNICFEDISIRISYHTLHVHQTWSCIAWGRWDSRAKASQEWKEETRRKKEWMKTASNFEYLWNEKLNSISKKRDLNENFHFFFESQLSNWFLCCFKVTACSNFASSSLSALALLQRSYSANFCSRPRQQGGVALLTAWQRALFR